MHDCSYADASCFFQLSHSHLCSSHSLRTFAEGDSAPQLLAVLFPQTGLSGLGCGKWVAGRLSILGVHTHPGTQMGSEALAQAPELGLEYVLRVLRKG